MPLVQLRRSAPRLRHTQRRLTSKQTAEPSRSPLPHRPAQHGVSLGATVVVFRRSAPLDEIEHRCPATTFGAVNNVVGKIYGPLVAATHCYCHVGHSQHLKIIAAITHRNNAIGDDLGMVKIGPNTDDVSLNARN